MENNNLIDGFEAPGTSRRPAFLTVLCILTWIGCALVIGVFGYGYLSLAPMLNEWAGDIPNELSWMLWNMIVSCIGALVCLLGSIVMWNFRRWGFYVYLVGQVVPIVMTTYVMMIVNSGMKAGASELLMIAVWVLIPIGFIVMYALHLKYLR